MNATQCKMARAALGWGVRDLAAAAKVATATVARFEHGDELKERTIEAMRSAMEAAGVIFTEEIGTEGVLLTKTARCVADIRNIAQRDLEREDAQALARGRIDNFLADLAEWQRMYPGQDGHQYRSLLHDRMLAASMADRGSPASDLLEQMIDYLAEPEK